MRAACGIHCGDLPAALETYDARPRNSLKERPKNRFPIGLYCHGDRSNSQWVLVCFGRCSFGVAHILGGNRAKTISGAIGSHGASFNVFKE